MADSSQATRIRAHITSLTMKTTRIASVIFQSHVGKTDDNLSRMRMWVRQAKKGSVEQTMPLGTFLERCQPYFTGAGRMIDQAYQERLPDGMVRCYMVHDQVVGFGHQAVNALYPAPTGSPAEEAPQPGPRLYHRPDKPAFQALKHKVETRWVPEMQQLLDIDTHWLPILWDCDFLFGPRDASGEDTFVLCEINVSSIAPFPDSAPLYVAAATLARIEAARQRLV